MEQRDETRQTDTDQARETPGLSGVFPGPPETAGQTPEAPAGLPAIQAEAPPEIQTEEPPAIRAEASPVIQTDAPPEIPAGKPPARGPEEDALSPDRDPREIVEAYRQPPRQTGTRERIFLYRRPLPEPMRRRRPEPPPEPNKELEEILELRRKARAQREARELDPRTVRRKRRKGILRFTAGFLVLALLAGLSMGLERPRRAGEPRLPVPSFREDGDWEDEDREAKEITIPRAPTGMGAFLEVQNTHDGPLTAQEIYRTVNPSVVLVMAQLRHGSSVGTGVIFTGDGYIVTNCHVLEGGKDCQVILDTGEVCAARYVGSDAESDLAVLKIDRRDLPAAQFGSSDDLTVGDRVYAIGNPLGVELRGTLTDGIVSAIDRDVWVDHRTMTLIQTNAALNSGNSGGPLINSFGQVVGINVIKMTSDYDNIEGLGFAIPSASMERIVNDLLDWGEAQPEPVLGLSVSVTAAVLPDGAMGLEVVELVEDSSADRAGVQVGDYVLRAGGEDLLTSRDLLRVRRRCHLGDQLPMTLWREGELVEVTLELEDPLEEEPEEAPWYVE